MTIIDLRGGPLDGQPHTIQGRIPDIIDLPWRHSSSRHIYELCLSKRGGKSVLFYLHAKTYRPHEQDCGR